MNAIIPANMRETHDSMFLKYLNNVSGKDVYRKKFLVGLNADGDLIPFIVNTKYFENMITGSQNIIIYAVTDEVFNNSTYVLLDSNFNILNLSANSKQVIGIGKTSILKYPNINCWFTNSSNLIK